LDVEDDEIGLLGVEPLQSLVAVGGLEHVVARPLEQLLHQSADVGFVVDDEYAAHLEPPGWPIPSLESGILASFIRLSYRNLPEFRHLPPMVRSWRVCGICGVFWARTPSSPWRSPFRWSPRRSSLPPRSRPDTRRPPGP